MAKKIGPHDTAGATALTSLASRRCPDVTTSLLYRLGDLLVCLSLKIAGNGIPKALQGRRGVFRFRRLGFVLCSRLLDSRMTPFRRRASRGSLSKTHPEFSFVSDARFGGKSCTPSELQDVAVSVRQSGIGTVPSRVRGD